MELVRTGIAVSKIRLAVNIRVLPAVITPLPMESVLLEIAVYQLTEPTNANRYVMDLLLVTVPQARCVKITVGAMDA